MIPNDVMMKIGDYKFGVSTACYHVLTKVREYRWQPIERIDGASAMQYMGESNQVITLNGVLYPHLGGGLKQIEQISKEATKGAPLLLVDGMGVVHGYWVIQRIEETQSVLSEQGKPKKISFTVSLSFYGDSLHS